MNFQASVKTTVGWIGLTSNSHAILKADFLGDEEGPTSNEIPQVLQKAIQELEDYFSGKLKHFTVHFDPEGTDFQKKIWRLLTDIPFGEKTTYLQLSRKFGDEKAIRAVASTNGRNPLPIFIPCHRVIGSDGSLTGFAGGLWRKKILLEHEQKFSLGTYQASLDF